MTEVKPICVIYFPDLFSNQNRQWIYEYMRYLNGEQSDGNTNWGDRKDYWNGYYWFCFYKQDISEPELKVFHPKDFTPIQFEEFKTLVLTELDKLKK